MRNSGIIGVRLKVRRTKRKIERDQNPDLEVGADEGKEAGPKASPAPREGREAARVERRVDLGVVAEASPKSEATREGGANQAEEEKAGHRVSRDRDQGQENLNPTPQCDRTRLEEEEGSSHDHILDLNRKVPRARRHHSPGQDLLQTRRRA